MIKGVTSTGFEYSVNEMALKSWDFLKAMRQLHAGDEYVVDVAEAILGKTQLDKLEKHLVKDGYIMAEDMGKEITEIIEGCKELKNC